jgi:hypothetical protein
MALASSVDAAPAVRTGRQAARPLWLERAGYGGLLGVTIAILEFTHYYPLVSTPDKLGLASLLSLLLGWGGEGVLLALTVALFEGWKAPRPLGVPRLALAVALGSLAGVLAWQVFLHLVLREQLGIWLFRDYVGLPPNLLGSILYNTWLMLVFGGLAAAVGASRARHARMLAALRAAELGRETSQRRLAEEKLAALQTRVDPEFVFHTLTRLERSYEADPRGAHRLLDELIVFLRRALAGGQASSASAVIDSDPSRNEAFQAK